MSSIGGGGGWVVPQGGYTFWGGGSPEFFWDTSTEFQIYRRNLELKPS